MRFDYDQRQIAKKRVTLRIKIYLWLFILIILMGGLFYLIVYSPIFKIQNIAVENNQGFSNDEILNILRPLIFKSRPAIFLGYRNLLIWPEHKIKIPGTILSEALINKNWFKRSIEITIKERQKFAVWCAREGDACYWMDKEGVIFSEAPLSEGSLLFTIFDPSGETVIGEKVMEERFAANLIIILENFPKFDLAAKRAIFYRDLQELRIETYEGPVLYFSLRFDPAFNMSALQSLIQGSGVKDKAYIDLRIENKLYYKTF